MYNNRKNRKPIIFEYEPEPDYCWIGYGALLLVIAAAILLSLI